MKQSSMSRRDFLQTTAMAVGATTLSGVLAACGGTSSSASGVVTLNYWDWWVSQAPWVDNEINLFQKAHPNIKIKKKTQADNYATLFPLAVQGHNEPDVFMIPLTPTLPEDRAAPLGAAAGQVGDGHLESAFPTEFLC